MKITPYLENAIAQRVYNECWGVREHHYKKLREQLGDAKPGSDEYAAWEKRVLKESEVLHLDVPKYSELRKKQLREWIESLPDMPPEELLAP